MAYAFWRNRPKTRLCNWAAGLGSISKSEIDWRIGSSAQVNLLPNTNPPDASCQLVRNGTTIACVTDTPSGVNVGKTKYDIEIRCNKSGYQ